jgi:hypothetical protein
MHLLAQPHLLLPPLLLLLLWLPTGGRKQQGWRKEVLLPQEVSLQGG